MSTWKKSSRSSQDGQCVEWSTDHVPGGVALRDSKNPDGGMLTLTSREWQVFVGKIKQEAFDC